MSMTKSNEVSVEVLTKRLVSVASQLGCSKVVLVDTLSGHPPVCLLKDIGAKLVITGFDTFILESQEDSRIGRLREYFHIDDVEFLRNELVQLLRDR